MVDLAGVDAGGLNQRLCVYAPSLITHCGHFAQLVFEANRLHRGHVCTMSL